MAVHKKIRTKIHKKHIGIFIFIAIFAGIGTYLLINSFAATETNPACTVTLSNGVSTSTIQSTVNNAAGGSVICIPPGNYTGTLNFSGTRSSTVIIQANPALNPNGAGKVTVGAVNIAKNSNNITVRNLYITGGVTIANNGGDQGGASNIRIEHNEITGGGSGVAAGGVNCSALYAPTYSGCVDTASVTNITITGNRIHGYGGGGGGEDAIKFNNWNGLTISYNEIYNVIESGQHNDGFQSTYGGANLVFDHNYEHDNNSQNLFIKDGEVTNGAQITNNLFLRNNVAGLSENTIQIYDTYGLVLRNNTEWSDNGNLLRADKTGYDAASDHNVFKSSLSNGCPSCSDGKQPFILTQNNNITGGTTSQFINPTVDDYRLASNPNGIGVNWKPSDYTYGPLDTSSTTPPTGPTANLWIDTSSGTHSCSRVANQETYATASDPANHRVCSSLSAAMGVAAGGDTVRLMPGSYAGFTPAVTKSPVVKFIGAGVDTTNVGTIDTQSGSGGLWFEGMTMGYYNRSGTDNVTYKNVKINGNFYIRGSNNITWDHVEAQMPGATTTTTSSNFISSDYSGGPGSKNITIRDSYIHHYRRAAGSSDHVDCIAIDDVDKLLIERSKFEDCEAFAIIFGKDNGTGQAGKNVVLQNNVFNQHNNGASGYYDLCFTDQDGPTVVRHNSFIDDHGISECELLSAPGSVTIDSNAWNHSGAICGSSTFIFKNNVGGDNVCTGGKQASPKFVSASDGHLQSGSPAIDYGSGSAYSNLSPPLTALTTDYDNANRTNPPDAGAYEYGSSTTPTPKPGDTNNDNVVNIIDLSTLLSKWNTNYSAADFNKDNTVNIFDLSILLSNYGK